MKDTKTYPIQAMSKGPKRAKIPTHRSQRWLAESEEGRTPIVQVFMTQAAYERICTHAQTDMDNEVGGWLAGRWCRDVETKQEFVVVEALLPAQQVRSGSTFLTFTHDSQVAMLAALEERYSKKGVVGWYHTHPRMGVFLSGYDTWLHDHFFPHPWQVALVVEPHSGQGGFFIRDREKQLDPRKYFGFYELRNRRPESVVTWKNLRAEKVAEPVAEPVKVQVKDEAKPVEVKAPKLERKEFKEIIATQTNEGGETPPLHQDDKRKGEVSSPTVIVKKSELTRVEVKPASQNRKIEIKTETNGSKNSEEAQS